MQLSPETATFFPEVVSPNSSPFLLDILPLMILIFVSMGISYPFRSTILFEVQTRECSESLSASEQSVSWQCFCDENLEDVHVNVVPVDEEALNVNCDAESIPSSIEVVDG